MTFLKFYMLDHPIRLCLAMIV